MRPALRPRSSGPATPAAGGTRVRPAPRLRPSSAAWPPLLDALPSPTRRRPGWRRAGAAVRRGGGRRVSGGAPADAPARGAEAGRRAFRRRRARPPRRRVSGSDEVAAVAAQLQPRGRARRGAGAVAPVAARQRQPRAALAAGAHEDGGVDARRAPRRRSAQRCSARSTPTSPSSTRWSRRCCSPAGSTPQAATLDAAEPVDLLGARRRGGRAGRRRRCRRRARRAGRARRRAPAAPRAAQPARERAPLRRRRRSTLSVRMRRRARRACELRVCDRGPGVPEAIARAHLRAVLPPARPCRAGRRRRPRPGLVKQIAERHGGSVRCEARDGGGSCFVISAAGGRRDAHAGAPAGAARACAGVQPQQHGGEHDAGASASPRCDAIQKPRGRRAATPAA